MSPPLRALLLILLAAPAAAQELSEAARDQARPLAEEAQAAYGARDYPRALALLQEAYRIYPSPKLKYSLGRVHEAAEQWPEAMIAYQEFLAEVPEAERVPGQGEEVRQAVRRLARRVGRIALEGPPGAWFQVDGGPRRALPAPQVWVLPGAHRVQFASGNLEVQATAGQATFVYLVGAPGGRGRLAAPGSSAPGASRTWPPSAWPREARLAKWLAGGLGLALLVIGAGVWSADGKPLCDLRPRQLECAERLSSSGAGAGLVSAGVLLLGGGAVLLGLELGYGARRGR
jgi:tetratricopeptide (TPR) repeat protein